MRIAYLFASAANLVNAVILAMASGQAYEQDEFGASYGLLALAATALVATWLLGDAASRKEL